MQRIEKTRDELERELIDLQLKYDTIKIAFEKGLNDKEKEKGFLKKLVEMSEEFVHFSDVPPDYTEILKVIIDISGAHYALLNVFDDNGLDFTTVAFTGGKIDKLNSILGFDITNKHWEHNAQHTEKSQEQPIIRQKHFQELAGNFIPKMAIKLIENVFKIDETYIVELVKEKKVLGDFILIFTKGETILNSNFVDLYAHQVALFLDRNKTSELLRASKAKSNAILQTLPDMMFIQDNKGVYIDFYIPPQVPKYDPPKVFMGQKIQNVLPQELIDKFLPCFENALKTKQIQILEYSLMMPDKMHYFEARTIHYETNIVLSIVRDITERKVTEETLLNERFLLRTLIDNIPDAIYSKDLNCRKTLAIKLRCI